MLKTLAIALSLAGLASTGIAFAGDTDRAVGVFRAAVEAADDASAARAVSSICPDPMEAARMLRSPAWGLKQGRPSPLVRIRARDGRSTDLHLHASAKYDGSKPFPCLLLLHGHGSNGRQMIEMCRPILERISCIGIAPDAAPYEGMLPVTRHWWKHTEDGFALESLKWARANLNVDPERVHVLGYSMGGFGAWNVSLRFPDHFASVVPLAGGISQLEFVGGTDRATRSLMPNAALFRLMFAHGDADRVVPVRFDRESHAELSRLGVPHDYREIEGGAHILSEVAAAARGDFESAGFLTEFVDAIAAAKRRDGGSLPVLTGFEAPAQARFIRVEAVRGGPFTIRASINGQEVSIEAGNAARITVLVDGAVLPIGREIAVTVNGRLAFRGIPKPDMESVVSSFRSWFDRGRVFVSRITLDIPALDEEGF